MSTDWSPADLNRQRLVVGRLVARADSDSVRVAAARKQLAERLQAVVVPLAVSAAAVAATVVIGRFVAVRRPPEPRARGAAAPAKARTSRLQSLVGLALSLAQVYLRVRPYIAPQTRAPHQPR